MPPPQYDSVEVLRDGDAIGNGMVVRLKAACGYRLHAVGVPQDRPSSTGPTWSYLIESDGLTLIDVGTPGSFQVLVDGLTLAGFSIKDVDRLVITHGHRDHDGAVGRLLNESNAELWAHGWYAQLLPYDHDEVYQRPLDPVQQEISRVMAIAMEDSPPESPPQRSARPADGEYTEGRKTVHVTRNLRDGDEAAGLRFLHTPGHSPDAICATLDGLVFTGDHVLPEITPHPTTKIRLVPEIKQKLPSEFQDESVVFGLTAYLLSLQRIEKLGPDVAVLPAHRFFNHGEFNFETPDRAGEIFQHHLRRIDRILARIGTEPVALEEVTRGIFAYRKLLGGSLKMALSEVVAHIELLQDAGDLEVNADRKLRWKGSERYKSIFEQPTRP